MKLFNLDLHISVIADIKDILEPLGHTVVSWCISNHTFVFGRRPDPVEIVRQDTWEGLDSTMCDAFYQRYKAELGGFDAYIVTHTPSFALLYEKFDKPIIVVASTRYEAPFSRNPKMWASFNTWLQKSIDEGRVIPIANNRYDAAYAEYFTGRVWKVIPSLCAYTGMVYQPVRPHFLYASQFSALPLSLRIPFLTPLRPKDRVLPRGYKWQDLANYKGVVHIPYNASQMSIFEQYTANVPLFFPGQRLLLELHAGYHSRGVLSQLSWNEVLGLPPGSSLPGCDARDPNRYNDTAALSPWIALADYYDPEFMPHLVYFDSFADLRRVLRETDLEAISARMRQFNARRKELIVARWAEALSTLTARTSA
jgi:hypothetical protein